MAGDYFGYDRNSQRYRDLSTGRFVSERSVRDGVDRVADLTARRLGDLSARFRSGDLTASAWQSEMLAAIKEAHVASALAAYGGRDAMTPERWGFVGYQIRVQYQYARQFAADVMSGRQRQNGRMDARARMYGQAARSTYENIRRRESGTAGLRYERNVLHASESCGGCLNASEQGWVPIGTLPPVGSRTCRGNCRCTLAYANNPQAELEAA